MTSSFVFINLGSTICAYLLINIMLHADIWLVIIVVLLAMTPRAEMHTASYVFGLEGIINNAKGWSNGIAFLFGLLSVEWTVCSFLKHLSYLDNMCYLVDDGALSSLQWLHYLLSPELLLPGLRCDRTHLVRATIIQ